MFGTLSKCRRQTRNSVAEGNVLDVSEPPEGYELKVRSLPGLAE